MSGNFTPRSHTPGNITVRAWLRSKLVGRGVRQPVFTLWSRNKYIFFFCREVTDDSSDRQTVAHLLWGYSRTGTLIWSLSQTTETRLLSVNRTQTGVVSGLLIGHNTLRRYFWIMGLTSSPVCRRCGAEEETSAHVSCECETVASFRLTYLGSFSWTQRMFRVSKSGGHLELQ